MTSIYSSNQTPIRHILPQKCLLRSKTDLQRLTLRRSHPISLEFRLEDNDRIISTPIKKLMTSLSKKSLKLKNPPLKPSLNTGNLTKHLRSLQLKPEEAAKFMTRITRRFSQVSHLAIIDEQDSFYPMRIKKRVHPMRQLRTFVYDHEFCRDFLRCARYASEVKIRKTALNFEELERFQRLEKIYLILKTKYLSLPDEDQRFAARLNQVLLKVPSIKDVIFEQEINPENNPFTFLEISESMKEKANVHLVADLEDVSYHRHKNLTIENVMQKISDLGIRNLKVNYAGVVKVMKRFERVFNAPIHTREDAYARFLKALMETPFEKAQFLPTVHSSHIDSQLQEILIKLLKSEHSAMKVPGLNIMYNLDMVQQDNLDLILDLFKQQGIPSYDMTIISTCEVRKSLVEKLKEHFSEVFMKTNETKTEYSLQFVAKNLNVLSTMIKPLGTKINSPLLKALNIQIIDPLQNGDLQTLFEILHFSGISKVVRKIGIDIDQKETPNAENLERFMLNVVQNSVRLNKFKLCYSNPRDCERIIKKSFEETRKKWCKVDFDYEINNERIIYE